MAADRERDRRRGTYGIDAPYWLVIPIVVTAWNAYHGLVYHRLIPLVVTPFMLAIVASGLYTSSRGKFVVWARLLDGLGLRGGERILDIGCGRGAVLLMAAGHLVSGRAVGADIWKSTDQSGNAPRATRANAVAEGVSGRVDLATADMTALPFAANSFDVILSNVAIHNVKGANRRDLAIDEAVRVLRPGGRLLIADLSGTRRYAERLRTRGMIQIEQSNLGWRVWWGGPWVPTRLVRASKR